MYFKVISGASSNKTNQATRNLLSPTFFLPSRPYLITLVIFPNISFYYLCQSAMLPSGEFFILAQSYPVFRILDANINRMREGLRIIEEYFRFVVNNPEITIDFKRLRHELKEIEKLIGRDNLISNRETATDCFANQNRPEELTRECIEDIVYAGFKRSQEASRVIEEYSKICCIDASEIAKKIRFSLYSFEKDFLEKYTK